MKSHNWYIDEQGFTQQCILRAEQMRESIKRIFEDMIGVRPQFVYCELDIRDCTWQITYCLPVDLPGEFTVKGREKQIEKLCHDIQKALKESYPEERITRMKLGRTALQQDIVISCPYIY